MGLDDRMTHTACCCSIHHFDFFFGYTNLKSLPHSYHFKSVSQPANWIVSYRRKMMMPYTWESEKSKVRTEERREDKDVFVCTMHT